MYYFTPQTWMPSKNKKISLLLPQITIIARGYHRPPSPPPPPPTTTTTRITTRTTLVELSCINERRKTEVFPSPHPVSPVHCVTQSRPNIQTHRIPAPTTTAEKLPRFGERNGTSEKSVTATPPSPCGEFTNYPNLSGPFPSLIIALAL